MMQALEMMYVYSPTSQRWTKSLLLVKGLYVPCTEFNLLRRRANARNVIHTISALVDQTPVQLTRQHRIKTVLSKLIFLIQIEMHYETGVFARKWRQV